MAVYVWCVRAEVERGEGNARGPRRELLRHPALRADRAVQLHGPLAVPREVPVKPQSVMRASKM